MKEKQICEYYILGESLSDISKKINVSKSTVYRILKKNNINTKRNSSDYIEKLYTYKIDDAFFEKIDTEEKAYILGFLYADGNLHKKYYHIKLKLQERDSYILRQMNEVMKSDKPLYFHKKTKSTHQNQLSFVISNKKMYYDIKKCGLYPNKTYDLNLKNDIFDEKLFKHFLRGFFDGDGWICVYENINKYKSKKTGKIKGNKRLVVEVGFTGSSEMCEYFKKYFKENLDISSNLKIDKRTDNRIKSLKITNKNGIKKFYNFIYGDCNIYLHRKKEKFEEFFKIKKQ